MELFLCYVTQKLSPEAFNVWGSGLDQPEARPVHMPNHLCMWLNLSAHFPLSLSVHIASNIRVIMVCEITKNR
jgi:hypothetical protein